MTEELKNKITDIIRANRDECANSREIADKVAEVVDAEIAKVLKLSDINGTPMGEILDGFGLKITQK